MSLKRVLCFALAFILFVGAALTLVSCKNDGYYKPIRSTREERRVIAKLGDYEINYELFRFIFMSRIDEFDGGDRSRWEGEGSFDLWQSAKKAVFADIAEFYAVFDLTKEYHVDPWGDGIEERVNESIRLDIDGGELYDGTYVSGYGSVKAYKKALKETYCTDAVRRLLYRYKACLEAIDSYIVGTHAEGTLTVTDAELLTFAASDECAHINRVFVSFSNWDYNREAALEYAQILHGRLVEADGNYDEMVRRVFSQSISSVNISTNPADGIWFSKRATSQRDYPKYYDAIFNTPVGTFTDIIEERDGFYIVYGMDKTVNLTESSVRTAVTNLYFEDLYWSKIRDAASGYENGVEYKSAFDRVTPSSMIGG